MRSSDSDATSIATDLYPVIEMGRFRKRYPPEVLRPRALHTTRVGRGLRERLGPRTILGLAFYPWHDQTTLWWFEQGLLSVLAATGWETQWHTDARYTFDEDRLAELDGRVSVIRHPRDDDWDSPEGRFDAVISLFPCDRATRAARKLGACLIAFAIKNLLEEEPPLIERPPDGTPLWHAFAGSTTFTDEAYGSKFSPDREPHRIFEPGRLGRTAPAWRLFGAPFPTNRYYFPVRRATIVYDALLFGSKSRDYDTAFAALARAGAGRVAALANLEDMGDVARAAERHGIAADVKEPMSHIDLLELLEQTRVVVNPILPPAESHYSLSVPLALGRPIVTTEIPSTRPFGGPGVILAPQGDIAAWTDAITRFLAETANEMPHRAALKQGLDHHDVDRFFASAILATMTGQCGRTGTSPTS
jgi:hypothetical protein